jgi:erythromycin esterase-like protein
LLGRKKIAFAVAQDKHPRWLHDLHVRQHMHQLIC